MKSFIGVIFLIALVELSHSSQIDPNSVLAEVEDYGRQQIVGLRMKRSARNKTLCYETYMSAITMSSEGAKNASDACAASADSKREAALQNSHSEELYLKKLVYDVIESLNSCTAETDFFVKLNCLQKEAAGNRKNLELIEVFSRTLTNKYDAIDKENQACVDEAIHRAKEVIDDALKNIERCSKEENMGQSELLHQGRYQLTTF